MQNWEVAVQPTMAKAQQSNAQTGALKNAAKEGCHKLHLAISPSVL